MKKRVIILGAIFLVVALLITAALRDPAKGADVGLVRGVQPYGWMVVSLGGSFPSGLQRAYSLHMFYDDAVKKLDAELGPKGWEHRDLYFESMFHNRDGKEWIRVTRGRVLLGSPMDVSNHSLMVPDSSDPSTDPHGWVRVETYRTISRVQSSFFNLSKWIANRGKKSSVGYWTSTPSAKKWGSDALPVDVQKGTPQLEGDTRTYSMGDTY